MVQEEIPFKGISYLELWQPFCYTEQNHLCNVFRGYYEEQFCEIILNSDQWFRRCHLKDYLFGALAALKFSGAKQFCAILKESVMGDIHVLSYMKFEPVV